MQKDGEGVEKAALAGFHGRPLSAHQMALGPEPAGGCANCGAEVSGNFCGNCGQKAHLHRSVLHATEEFLHGIVHFDGRFWHTLPLLLFRPGKLTRDYVYGRRQRYIAPIALFLLTIFAMFLLFGLVPSQSLPDGAIVVDSTPVNKGGDSIRADRAELERRLAQARQDPDRAGEVRGLELAVKLLDHSEGTSGGGTDAAGAIAEGSAPNSLADVIRAEAASGGLVANTGNAELDAQIGRALQNPEFTFYKIQQKGYKLSFLLIPLSLPWMILLLLRRKGVYIYDHVVFLLYSISFMSILFMVGTVMFGFGVSNNSLWAVLFGVVPVAHMFAQLKEGYALGWFSAAWRTALLTIFSTITLSIFVMAIIMLGLID